MSTSHFPSSTMANYPPGSEQSRPRTRPRLGFQEAMDNFSTMFPTMDRSIIEAVLRSCNGNIQQTIDKLLVMTDSSPPNDTDTHLDQQPETLIDFGDQENTSNNADDNNQQILTQDNNYNGGLTIDQSIGNNHNTSSQSSSNDNNSSGINTTTAKYRPPLVGRLPDNFLRIEPVPVRVGSHHMPAYDPVALQMMEDERLAKWLQNEEFMRHLQSNEDFVRSLESEHNHGNRRSRHANNNSNNNNRAPQQSRVPTEEATRRTIEDGAVGGYDEDDTYNKKKLSTAEFREKLKTMGSTTKEKFYHLAHKFNRKKKPNSSRQLLLDCDDFDIIPDQSEIDYGATEQADSQDYMNNNDQPTRDAASEPLLSSPKQLNNQMDQRHAINNANSTTSNVVDPATGRTLESNDRFMGRR